jgi:hypothetical protein
MTTQGALFRGVDHAADAARWIEEFPEAFEIFCKRALAAQSAGGKVGSRCIWEVMRWSLALGKPQGQDYKLNDHFPPYVAREAVRRHPELDGFFEFRKTKGAI